MSEQDAMTPEEARDLTDKLEILARDLSPKQLEYLSALLKAGAESSEVEGYIMRTTAEEPVTLNLCTGNAFCDSSWQRCAGTWNCTPSFECPSIYCVAH